MLRPGVVLFFNWKIIPDPKTVFGKQADVLEKNDLQPNSCVLICISAL